MTRIAIPALPQHLSSSSTDLVDLRLHEIPMAGYFSPQVDDFVARIDAPRLGDIDITLFGQPTMDALQLGKFIERIGMTTALSEVDIQASVHAISFFKNSSTSTSFRLQISCKQLDWQLSSMAQVCTKFSPFVFGVQHLVFNTNDWSSGQDDVNGEQWLQLVRSFSGAKTLSIAGELATGLLHALRPVDGYTTDTVVLPALRNLRVQKPVLLDLPFWDAALTLVTSRGLSCGLIDSELRVQCHICNTSFTSLKLRGHLVAHHAYEIVCSYCGDFQFTPTYLHRFQEHIRSKHPEVVKIDVLIIRSTLALTPLQLDTLGNRHSSLRESQIVASSPLVTPSYLPVFPYPVFPPSEFPTQ